MKNVMKNLSLLIATLSLNACMTTQSFTPENKVAIHKITVDKDVILAKDMTYVGPGIGFVGLLSLPASMSTADQIKYISAKNNIKIDKIARDQFINDIKRDTKLAVIDHGKADANLKIDVLAYGFIVPQGFSLEVSPTVWLSAKLMQGETTVWQNNYRVSGAFYSMKTYKTEDLLKNPNLISSALHDAVDKAASVLTKDLA